MISRARGTISSGRSRITLVSKSFDSRRDNQRAATVIRYWGAQEAFFEARRQRKRPLEMKQCFMPHLFVYFTTASIVQRIMVMLSCGKHFFGVFIVYVLYVLLVYILVVLSLLFCCCWSWNCCFMIKWLYHYLML